MLKKIGFIAAGLCGATGLMGFVSAVYNLTNMQSFSSLDWSTIMIWILSSSFSAMAWIMLAVFVGMLAYKLK
jgi:hypothetical protein|tara:strand:+ start:365 stop:580 length:216 start_codon:yes stop_codon:yes gene_type:complete